MLILLNLSLSKLSYTVKTDLKKNQIIYEYKDGLNTVWNKAESVILQLFNGIEICFIPDGAAVFFIPLTILNNVCLHKATNFMNIVNL